MNPRKCPRCGEILIKEEMEMRARERITNGALPQPYSEGSACREGSHDVLADSRINYIYRCPKCGYLHIE